MFQAAGRFRIACVLLVLLLTKAAMPALAAAAAQSQGVQLVEICTVYGISLVSVDATGSRERAPAEHSAQGDGHCPLASLGAWMVPRDASGPSVRTLRIGQGPPPIVVAAVPHDATARWVAGLKHAPPH